MVMAAAADVPLAEDFFDPTIFNGQGQPTTTDPVTGLTTTNIGAVLKGDADGDAQAEDVQAINGVRNLLFNEVVPGVGFGQDLSLSTSRGLGITASGLTTKSGSRWDFQP